MNQDYIVLLQRFFFIKREVTIDLKKRQIKMHLSSFRRKEETIFSLDEMDRNSLQLLTNTSTRWLIHIFLILSCLSYGLALFQTTLMDKIIYGLFFLTVIGIGIFSYFYSRFNLLIYKTSKGKYFYMLIDNPDCQSYEAFISRLNKLITDAYKRKELRLIIQAVPSDLLEKEFGLFYLQELQDKDVNVCELIDLLRKNFLSRYLPENKVGTQLN